MRSATSIGTGAPPTTAPVSDGSFILFFSTKFKRSIIIVGVANRCVQLYLLIDSTIDLTLYMIPVKTKNMFGI